MPRARPGKYDAVLPGLPKSPPDITRQERIDKIKNAVFDRAPLILAHDYILLRQQHDALKDQLSAVNVKIDAYEQLLIESQEASDSDWGRYGVKRNALRLPDGTTLRVHPEPYGQVQDKEAFREWCIANGYARQLQLWPSTMNAIVKERLLAGEPEPDGCRAYVKTTVVLTPKESV